MPRPEQISGASIPMKVGNKVFNAKALSDRDYDELNAYCRFKFVENGKDAIDEMFLGRESRQEMLTSLMLASSQVTFNSAEGSKVINTSTDGIARVGWQMIKDNHDVAIEEFTKLVRGDESEGHLMSTLSNINQAFIYLNISPPEDTKDDEDDDKSESEEDSDKEPKSD
jgi:hypothetical protein